MTTGTATATATAAAAVIGLTARKRLLSSSAYYSDFPDRLGGWASVTSIKCSITVASSSRIISLSPAKALRERPASFRSSSVEPAVAAAADHSSNDDLDAFLLLQKSMLETQWNLCIKPPERSSEDEILVIGSGPSARQRRISAKRKTLMKAACSKPSRVAIGPELLQRRGKGYVRGELSDDLLTQAEVVRLSEKIMAGLSFEDQRFRLLKRLGYESSDEQLAYSLKISRAELQGKMIETKLAREKLAMSNVRLVMSITQIYDNMGAEMSDLVQGGLIGLLGGIEKFDSFKGFKISTYVYWWIRQMSDAPLLKSR